jgi:hypothetical protein
LPANGCWLWLGKPNPAGYGRATTGTRRVELAHRAAWRLVHGDLSPDACVLHHCDNPMCVRAELDPKTSHLFLGDRGDNARDMASKGRAHLQRNPRALAGERHWTRRHPERIARKGARPCANCGTPTNPLRRGLRCGACHSYFTKRGIERPARLFAKEIC